MKMSLLVAAVVIGLCSSAYADSIAQWTFETSAPTTAGPFSPEVGTGAASGSHASGLTVYSSPLGDGSAQSFSSNHWGVGDYYQFQTSTTGYTDIQVAWNQTSSSTGPGSFELQYSTDGSTFIDQAAYIVGTTSWSSTGSPKATIESFDLASLLALNNASSVYFRLVDTSTAAAGGGTVGTSGADRVDNFTISGTPIPAAVPLPSAAAAGMGLLALLAASTAWKSRRLLAVHS